MQLPIDCIEFIADHLEVWDLAPLLTVNSVFFNPSVKRLYANPTRFFKYFDAHQRYRDNTRARYQAAERLLVIILRYSPAQDPDIHSLRLSLSAALKTLPEKPTVDYLSLIKALPYDERSFGIKSAEALMKPLMLNNYAHADKGLHSVLVWAACGHRLNDMSEIGIHWCDLDRYHRCIENMTSIRSIRLHLPAMHRKNDAHPILIDVLHFMEKWAEAYAKFGESRHHSPDIQLVSKLYLGWPIDAPCSQLLQRIFALMPKSTLTEINTRRHLDWVRLIRAPETIDLSCVHTFVSHLTEQSASWPKGVSMATILQWFRNLRRLELKYSSAIDYDLFQWAYEERQQIASTITATTSTSSNGTDSLSLVPLSELELSFSKNVPWQSAIYGFGATLTTVKVSGHEGCRVDLCAFHDIPNLQCLDLSVDYIDNTRSAIPFSRCPRLDSLTLRCRRDEQFAWNNMQNLHMLCNQFEYRPMDYEIVAGSRQKFDRWDLPRLKRLTLTGFICYRFHQETLRTMGKLEYLNFNDRYDHYNHPEDLSLKWSMCDWTHASFPQLKELHLHGYPARTFAWSMLDQCPALEHLDLGSLTIEKQVELDSKLWPRPLTSHPNILKLAMAGFDISEKQQPHIFDLVQAMPNLTTLELYSCIDVDSSLRRRLQAMLPWLEDHHLSIDLPRPLFYL